MEVNRVFERQFSLLGTRFALVGVVGIGLAFLAATVWSWWATDLATFDAFIVAFPALTMLVLLAGVARSSLSVEFYSEVLKGVVGGVAVMGGFILLVLLFQGDPLVDGVPLLLFMMGFGGVAGELIGLTLGLNKRSERQARNLAEQQERLVFLNQLLRHNVLNKIGIIKGHVELLEQDHELDDPTIDTITSHSEDITELISNIRVLVNASTRDYANDATDLSSALRAEVDSLEQSFSDVEVEANVPDDVAVIGDDLTRYVFENVLHNAVEHNDADTPHIDVAVERDGEHVLVTIADNGPGVPAHIRERIHEGTLEANHGVGLYLVNTLMTAYGGSLDFVETGPEGTTLQLTFRAPDR